MFIRRNLQTLATIDYLVKVTVVALFLGLLAGCFGVGFVVGFSQSREQAKAEQKAAPPARTDKKLLRCWLNPR